MKFLLCSNETYIQQDIAIIFEKIGIEYRKIQIRLEDICGGESFENRIVGLMEREDVDAIFSVDYYSVLASICDNIGVSYISWIFSPIIADDIEKTLGYPTNTVFFFDRAVCIKYRRNGFANVFHMPLAVNIERMDNIKLTEQDKVWYGAEVSFVGQLYEDELSSLMEPLEEYEKGYLTAVIETQLRLYGNYFLPHVISDKLLENMKRCYEKLGLNSFRFNREEFIMAVTKQITRMERILLLDILSEKYRVKLFGPDITDELDNVDMQETMLNFAVTSKASKGSKVNLNISLKSIEMGIPLSVLEIMGSGGFLLTNYQPEIAEHFIDGEELVMYTSLADAVEKCEYYLTHEEERKKIAECGYKKVKLEFGYEDRIRRILEAANLKCLD